MDRFVIEETEEEKAAKKRELKGLIIPHFRAILLSMIPVVVTAWLFNQWGANFHYIYG